MQASELINKISVATRLTAINTVIVELNFLHMKYNYLFFDAVLKFQEGSSRSTEFLECCLSKIREQPEGCLQVVSWFERLLMRAVGTYQAVELCHQHNEEKYVKVIIFDKDNVLSI